MFLALIEFSDVVEQTDNIIIFGMAQWQLWSLTSEL